MKSSKRVSTTVNRDPYEELEEQYRIAVDMRLENYAYADIGTHLKVKEQTARKWFIVGGLCHAAYEWKRQIRMEERRERFAAIETQLHEMAADAILTLKRQLKKGSESAAIRVLELAGFSPIHKVQEIPPEESEELKLLRELVDMHETTGTAVPPKQQPN